ncbi:MAG: hypothetical protein ACXWOV_11975, partial [Isosphaeraceae bacterium]
MSLVLFKLPIHPRLSLGTFVGNVKDVPQVLFNSHPATPLEPTVLSVRVQPEEGLSMRIASKLPGPKIRI